ncbi:palmitoyl-monogalactosyldiacylglycerol delta-7 desaturase, chloroplastic-like [Cucurbita pepo subsp. pepo]|uniref:palmitoyl-monogalactosyldiacylglycerol delta-7 desaturase, chloroplastic-like n=1 Tax=Cucurbita pepo subsp. pepo TaxID=3664 RepID=UPI000C9D8435|nr:palmitoyl-monogalactosyldiacylglycerol delta-7 desaturase, chloroplastic-like [Cucurbita pepo subsp. pepo]
MRNTKKVAFSMVKSKPSLLNRKWTILDRRSAGGVLFLHFLSLLAPFHCNWPAFWVAFALYFITGLFGVTLSYHRNLAHKSFKLPKWFEYLFAYLGVQAFQGDPIDWVSTHRYHHQFVDTDRDPHSPLDGFWFSHLAWMFDAYTLTKKVCPKNVQDFEERSTKRKRFRNVLVGYVKYGRPNNVEDLQKQGFYRFLRKTYILHPTALAIVLYATGGLPFVVWGMGVRLVWVLHITFFVNSACHIWGYRLWDTNDLSKNNWVIGLLAFGEGWHNNHHAFEYSARHGYEWWEFDLTWCVILFLQALGLATNVKLPSARHQQKLALNPKTSR